MRGTTRYAAHTLALIGLLLGTGCVHFAAEPLVPEWTSAGQIHEQENHGLLVAARALNAGDEEIQYIGRPTRSRGYLPVVLYFENKSDAAFIIRRRGIRLQTRDKQSFRAASMYDVYEDIRYSKSSALWGLPLGVLPAFVMGEQIDDQNQEFLEDFREKAFHDIRLGQSPRSYHCVVFFKMKSDQALELAPENLVVSVEVEPQDSQQPSDEFIQFRLVPEESKN